MISIISSRKCLFTIDFDLTNAHFTCGDEEVRRNSVVFTLNPPEVLLLLLVPSSEVIVGVIEVGASSHPSSSLRIGAGSITIEGLVVLPGSSGCERCRDIQYVPDVLGCWLDSSGCECCFAR